MKNIFKNLLFCSVLAITLPVFSRGPSAKYGDVRPEDFAPQAYAVDSSASGVVLFDIGSSSYEGDQHGGFSIIYKRHMRIRLLNRNSFDLATITIPLYASGQYEETIEKLEATTYNLEDSKVKSVALDKNSIFSDRLNKNFTRRKFTLPNLKEGSIIEIKYTLKSPYERDLRSWDFQRSYPVLWSEYNVTIPYFYDFAVIQQGYQPFVVDEGKTTNESYDISDIGNSATSRTEYFSVRSTAAQHKWAMKDVPALKEENFTTTVANHISRLDFQLSKIRFPNVPEKNVMRDWISVSEDLLKNPDFGEALTNLPGWIHDEAKKITAGSKADADIANKIFNYIRDNISCTDNSATHLSMGLKKVYQGKHGNVADINLLLTAFLLSEGLNAHPVLLSTSDHGKAMEIYPVMDKMNYVICQVTINNKPYLLDASNSRLGFGQLPISCYNGFARVIDKNIPALLDLSADSICEHKSTSVFIINDEKGGLTGSFTSNVGCYGSQQIREQIGKTSEEDYFKKLKKDASFDVEMTNPSIDSLKLYDSPVAVKFDFKMNTDEDIIYLNPIFEGAYKENPFKAAERKYPVEMPYLLNENFFLTMDIPKGYSVEEVPKSSKVKLNENEGLFEYLIAKDNNTIQLRSTLKLNRATFFPEDYQTLRDFFGYVVKKHSEQIVLKKIK